MDKVPRPFLESNQSNKSLTELAFYSDSRTAVQTYLQSVQHKHKHVSVVSAVQSNDERMLRVLLQVPQALHWKDLHQAFFLCCKQGLHWALAHIIKAGVDVETEDGCGNRGLHYSVAGSYEEVTRLLLEHGASPNVRGVSRNYPLHMAARGNMLKCMQLLLVKNAFINAKDSAKQTALIVATRERRYEAIQVLIESGCGLDCKDKDGRTALHYACQLGSAVDILLDAGAGPDITDNSNCTPLLLAASEGFSHVVKLLCKANCNPNIVNDVVYKSPLHILAHKGHTECLDDLLNAGADMNLTDSKSRTPMWYAVDNLRYQTVKYLLKANTRTESYQCSVHIPYDACPLRAAIDKKSLRILKMFILTGFDKKHLKDCELLNGFDEELSSWICHANNVMSLKQLCRRWIRHHSENKLLHNISGLPLGVVDYLLLKELDQL